MNRHAALGARGLAADRKANWLVEVRRYPVGRLKLPVVALLLSVAGMFVIGEVLLHQQADLLVRREHASLQATVELKVAEIEAWREERLEDASLLTADSHFLADVDAWRRGGWPAGDPYQRLREYLQSACRARDCVSAALVDDHGTPLLVSGSSVLATSSMLGELAILRAVRRPIWVDLRLSADSTGAAAPQMALLVPLPAAATAALAGVTILELTIDPRVSLYPMVRRWPTASPSAETMLVRSDGESVVCLSELRYRAGTALHLRRRLNDPHQLAAAAARGATGPVDALDYRQVAVLGSVARVPGTPWSLIAKLDRAEVVAPIADERRSGLALLAVLSLILAALLALWWRHEVARWQLGEARRELGERMADRNAAEALRKGHDAVLLIDADLRIVLANERAAELYGYALAELVGRPVTDLGGPVCEQDFDAQWRPDAQREGRVFETEHRRHGGTRLQVEVTVGFLSIDDQVYQQCIVRDISDRKRTEGALLRAEERWRFALEGAGDGAWDCDMLTGEIVRSPRCFELFGLPAESAGLDLGSWHDRLHPADRDAVLAALTSHLEGLAPAFSAEYRMRIGSGSFRWFLDRGKIVERDADGQPLRMIGTLSDIHERKQREMRQRLLASVFENSNEAIVITEADGTIVSVNDAFARITGFSTAEALESTPRILHSNLHDAEFYARMWSSLKTSGQWSGEIWNRRKDGELYPAWLSISAVGEPGGRVTHYVGIHSDISERKAVEDRVRHLAHHDALTGLPNRSLLGDRLEQAVLASQRTDRKPAVLFLDLDCFKPINDSFGHAVGDLLLKQVADRLRGALRESDTVARLGGDEFVVLLPDLQSSSAVAAVAAKLHAEIERPFTVEGHQLRVTVSVGTAIYPEDGATESDLIRSADAAMYMAKENGRGAEVPKTGASTGPVFGIRRRPREKVARIGSRLAKGVFGPTLQPSATAASPATGAPALAASGDSTPRLRGTAAPSPARRAM